MEEIEQDRHEDKHKQQGVENANASFDAIIYEVEQAGPDAGQMQGEQRQDQEPAILRDLARHEMHDVEDRRIVIVLPFNLFLLVKRGRLLVLQHSALRL